MRRVATGLAVGAWLLLTQAMPVWASCTTQTYWINGRYLTCTTCCWMQNCHTTCV